MKAEEIIKQIDQRVEQPFVTAKFGDNWRQHQKRMLDEGQINFDMLLDIAWKQGRRALLLEQALRNMPDVTSDLMIKIQDEYLQFGKHWDCKDNRFIILNEKHIVKIK